MREELRRDIIAVIGDRLGVGHLKATSVAQIGHKIDLYFLGEIKVRNTKRYLQSNAFRILLEEIRENEGI